VRIKGVVLENHGDVTIFRIQAVDDPIPDKDASLAGLLQTSYHTENGTLPATRGTDEYQELFVQNIQVDVLHYLDFVEPLEDVLEFDTSHR